MLKFKTSCAVLANLSSNLLNEVGLSFFRYFEVGLRVCDIVVNKYVRYLISWWVLVHLWNAVSPKRCKIGGLVLIINRKSYMSFRLVPKSVTLNDLELRNSPLFCLILSNSVISGAYCVKMVDKAITVDNLWLLCSVVNVGWGTARRTRYKYSITAWWKFCSRFINLRFNAQHFPSYRLIC